MSEQIDGAIAAANDSLAFLRQLDDTLDHFAGEQFAAAVDRLFVDPAGIESWQMANWMMKGDYSWHLTTGRVEDAHFWLIPCKRRVWHYAIEQPCDDTWIPADLTGPLRYKPIAHVEELVFNTPHIGKRFGPFVHLGDDVYEVRSTESIN